MTNIDLLIYVLTLAAIVYLFKEWIAAVIWMVRAYRQWNIQMKDKVYQKNEFIRFSLMEEAGFEITTKGGHGEIYWQKGNFGIMASDIGNMDIKTVKKFINKNR